MNKENEEISKRLYIIQDDKIDTRSIIPGFDIDEYDFDGDDQGHICKCGFKKDVPCDCDCHYPERWKENSKV